MSLDVRPVAVIPARANSSRFPKKILAPILGKPMIQWVWEAATRATSLADVWVATDSDEIDAVVKGFGGKSVLTGGDFSSGTDRVAHVVADWSNDLVINVQGDEPTLDPIAIDRLVEALRENPEVGMATLAVRMKDRKRLSDPNTVKVVVSRSNEALYFSRHPLASQPDHEFFKHIGIYAYRKETLQKLTQLPPSPLELTERLEQLRALENGVRIKVVEVAQDTHAVDTPGDIELVEKFLSTVSRRT